MEPQLSIVPAAAAPLHFAQAAAAQLQNTKEKTHPSPYQWQPKGIKDELTTIVKMCANALKALSEHISRSPDSEYVYRMKPLPNAEAIFAYKPTGILHFSCTADERQGIRKSMEDAHFFKNIEKGAIAGIFDGHCGREVADFVCREMQEKFSSYLEKGEGNVHFAFENLIHDIHTEIISNHKEWDNQGTAAVICYIDKYTHRIYTATVGDCEANIYRINQEGQLKSIPLSCIRDWKHTGEAVRAATIRKRPDLVLPFINAQNPKLLRFGSRGRLGLNLSRAIGDNHTNKEWPEPPICHKAKITVTLLEPNNDLVVLVCDGVKDYVSEKEIVDHLSSIQHSATNIAQSLASLAMKKSEDNITVVAIEVKESSEELV